MKNKLTLWANTLKSKPNIVLGLLILLGVLISIQRIALGNKVFFGGTYTNFNNYIIFKQSFIHLFNNVNLYTFYPAEYADLYKYSPTFALFMALFYPLPNVIGLMLWNGLNLFVFYWGIQSFKYISQNQKWLMLGYVVFELILSTQNSQSNCLLAGLTLIAFNSLENGKNAWATLCLVLGFYVKIYSVLGCLLLLFYPRKLYSALTLVFWSALLFVLPLVVIDLNALLQQYMNWVELLKMDQSQSIGMSVYAFSSLLLPSAYFKTITLSLGVAMLLVPLVKIRRYSESIFRIQYLALILIWMVVYNYKAESPTFIIALTGVALWYLSVPKTRFTVVILLSALLFTSLWFTDIVPTALKTMFIAPVYLKPFFPTLVMLLLLGKLMVQKHSHFKPLIEHK